METVLFSCENRGIDICSDRKTSDLECADDVVLLSEYLSKLQVLDRLKGIGFTSSKCKMLLQDRIDSRPKLVAASEKIVKVGRHCYVDSLVVESNSLLKLNPGTLLPLMLCLSTVFDESRRLSIWSSFLVSIKTAMDNSI